MKRKIVMACVCLSASLLTGGCNNTKQDTTTESSHTEEQTESDEDVSDEEASKDIFAMDTYMTVTAYGEQAQEAVDEAGAEIERIDNLLSTGNEESEIAKLNQSGSATLSEDAGYLVERALELNEETDGAFDIAIYPVMEAWGFPTQNYQVPSEDTLQSLLKLCDVSQITYDKDNRGISFNQEGIKIDLGGIAKGYTSSRIMEIYKENNISSGLVNLGGNVQALGTKTDGSKWRVVVQSPDDSDDCLGVLSIEDKAVITSGGYERYFEQDGKNYHHVSSVQDLNGHTVVDSGLKGTFTEYDENHEVIATYQMDIEKFIYRVYKYNFHGFYFGG